MSRNELVPENAWDTHIHVFDPEKFPYGVPRSYTPAEASIAEYPTATTGCTNIIVVHASVQGTSPAALLDTLSKQKTVGLGLRGLATIDVNGITDDELDALHAAGVRGARLHEMSWGHGHQSRGTEIANKVKALAARTARLGWVIGIFCDVRAWASMADMIRCLDPRIKLVADHLGGTMPGEENTPEFATFLQLIRENRLSVKLSGFERLYHGNPDGIDCLTPIVKAIVEAGPDQIMFGSDWPHTQLGFTRKGKTDTERLSNVEGFRQVDIPGHIKKLREWIPDDTTWHNFWVDNPQKLFA